jgi:histidine ammonia-lyase
MKKPGTILLMAVVLGALVSAWVYNLIRSKERQVEAARAAAAGDTIELVVAAQAVDLRGATPLGHLTSTLHARVRELVPALGPGDPIPQDLEPVVELVRTGLG